MSVTRPDDGPRCSAKDCRAPATADLTWRNPRLHDSARTKHWLACDEHVEHLADFLDRRGFLLGRDPLRPPTPDDTDPDSVTPDGPTPG